MNGTSSVRTATANSLVKTAPSYSVGHLGEDQPAVKEAEHDTDRRHYYGEDEVAIKHSGGKAGHRPARIFLRPARRYPG